MKSWDREQFFKYTRMTIHVFQMVLKTVKPIIEKNKRSDGVSAEERLIIIYNFTVSA
jgi:uncharacterized Fe-S cluster-containing radical SAM superfamily protein